MAQEPTDRRALAFMRKCESEGLTVRKLIIEGKRIEVEFDTPEKKPNDNLDHVKW